jgi:hypothetical protein
LIDTHLIQTAQLLMTVRQYHLPSCNIVTMTNVMK